jgi:hypothetical protein
VEVTTQSVRSRGQSIVVAPGISLKPIIEGSVGVGPVDISALDGTERARASFRLEYSPHAGRYEIASFGIDRGMLPLEVSGAFLRTVRVHSIVRRSVLRSLPLWTFPVSMLRERRRLGTLPNPVEFELNRVDSLLLTALVYRMAEIADENPVEAVAETLGLKLRTATNWIARARAAGHMTTTMEQAAVRKIAMGLIEAMGLELDVSEKEHQRFLDSLRKEE